jgi:cellulose synthase (UDP-forming)
MTALTVLHLIAVGRTISNTPELCALLVFATIVLLLVYGGLVHQWARAGYFMRLARHRPEARDVLEQVFRQVAPPPLGILIPSYKEELSVLRTTLLSAALVEYPNRHIVVLLDDPPNGSSEDILALQRARAMIAELDRLFARIARPFRDELNAFLARRRHGSDSGMECQRLSWLYEQAARQLENWAADLCREKGGSFAHMRRFFVERVLYRQAKDHRARAARIARNACRDFEHEYRRLASQFSVPITSFERKLFSNLSHAPNKAMNLNSYIGLMGGHFHAADSASGTVLIPCPAEQACFVAPPAEYILTLDADSVVLTDYALKLVRILEADPDIGVVQTPYSAFPGAINRLERIAGATTDIQYIVHQGFTAFRAGYWVGANALLRYRALLDICVESEERGHRIPVFIQDRTVIEDTGSTIDLIRRGWSVHNYTERLAYSATPPDFGSLVIQRRRWSNGGLLILPDLLRFCFGPKSNRASWQEALLRVHYLVSPAVASLGLLILLLFPFDVRYSYNFLPLTAIPYFFLYGLDLRLNGYRWIDLMRVYALNLLLLPVNLAGVIASLQQALTGRKSAFGRTPKIEGQTITPPGFLAFHISAVVYLVSSGVAGILLGHYFNGIFAAMNAAMFTYGICTFIAAPAQQGSIPRIAA